MTFLKKYGTAILVTLLLIGLAVWVGVDKASTAVSDNYYRQWVIDEANLLSEDTESRLASYNEDLDRKYGSVVGLITIADLDGADIADEIYYQANEYGFGQNDIVLLISRDDATWYMDFGNTMANYTNNKLRTTTIQHMTDDVYTEADSTILDLYEALRGWYKNNVPESDGENFGRHRAASGSDVIGGFFSLVLTLFVLLCVFRYVIYPIFRLPNVGTWRPLWGWGLFGPFRFGGHWHHHHHRPPRNPPPPGGFHDFDGGFGSGSRGSFGGGHGFGGSSRGGFGGGSRGGFGGGRR